MTFLTENLDYLDMEGQVSDKISVDEYAAKMGSNAAIVTLAFTVYSELAGEDLVTWFERGYDFVMDASISEGEVEPGKYLVFVEMERRIKVPERICRLLSDLETLTGYKLKDWTVDIDGDSYDADPKIIGSKMILNPGEYKAENEKDEELNEVRKRAGIEPVTAGYTNDEYIKNLKAMAGM
jgi:hypothetical protein